MVSLRPDSGPTQVMNRLEFPAKMPAMPTPDASRLSLARQLVREKGLSRRDLTLLAEILDAGEEDLGPLMGSQPEEAEAAPAPASSETLRRELGLFLAFLGAFNARKPSELRTAMGPVIQNALAHLGRQARAAHRALLEQQEAPSWVIQLLDLVAGLRALALAQGSESGAALQEHWMGFLVQHQGAFREILGQLQAQPGGAERVAKLNTSLKALNRAIQTGGRMPEALRRFTEQLQTALPADTQDRVAPLLLLEHVLDNLRLSLLRPIDRGIHWPAMEQVRGSLIWLWNHLGWRLPRMEREVLTAALDPESRRMLLDLRRQRPEAFRLVARALTSHLSVLSLLEHEVSATTLTVEERYAAVPKLLVVESELGRLSDRCYNPQSADQLPPGAEEAPQLRAYLRQAVLGLRQDQSTVRSLLQQALATQDSDHLAQALDNLRQLLVSHQKQLMGDLVGIFSPELRHRLFPGSPSAVEEGDRLRQRLQRLFEALRPLHEQVQVHLELQDWARLALSLSTAQQHLQAFRRSPEFPLLRSNDREEAERLIQQQARLLENPPELPRALRECLDLLNEFMRFLELFLLRINARLPLIRHDLDIAREALALVRQLQSDGGGPEHTRAAHRLIQGAKRLGVRDPQGLQLLKRWVRAERSTKDTAQPLEQLGKHLERLASRLEAALE